MQPISIKIANGRFGIATGKAHYQEEYLLEEMMSSMTCEAVALGRKAGIEIPEFVCLSVLAAGSDTRNGSYEPR